MTDGKNQNTRGTAPGLVAFLCAAILPPVLASVAGGLRLVRLSGMRLRPKMALLKIGIGYSLRAYLATLFGFLMMRAGVLVLQINADMTTVGVFSIAQQISDALILLPSTVGLLLFPDLLRLKDSDQRRRAMAGVAIRLGLAMAAILALGVVATPWLLPRIFGAAYAGAVPLVFWFFPSVMILSLIVVVSQFLSAQGFPWGQVATWIGGTILHTGLSMSLVGPMGARGVLLSLMISMAGILMSLSLIAMRGSGRAPTEGAAPQ